MDKVLFIIPARSGSTRVKNKNIKKLSSAEWPSVTAELS